ncbi:MAG: hypothetical protein KC944_02245 [Candidatus Omnitrophica bacterium]|nr:hypothetical protein [Candidatus Omnitrophota bacterium]MCA9439422.1 hypothetical protein [Candidatus Omnitrophota bacterium]
MIRPTNHQSGPIQEYFLNHLLRFKGENLLSNLRGIDCSVGFEIEAEPDNQRFLLVLKDGAIESVTEGWQEAPQIVYRTGEETFHRVVGGWQRAEAAFLRRQIGIRGNLLKGLKLAFLLQEFFDRFPYRPIELEGLYDFEETTAREKAALPEPIIEERIEVSENLPIKAVYSEEGSPCFSAILAPPHPFLGGSSENRLLLNLSAELAQRGGFVARFDYQGGESAQGGDQGVRSFWEDSDAGYRLGVDEILSIHRWLSERDYLRHKPVVWIGYSYGAQVCMWAMERTAPDRQIFISPVVSRILDERFNCKQKALLIGGSDDFATTATEFQIFSESLLTDPQTRMIKGADHFYTDRMDELLEAVLEYLDPCLSVENDVVPLREKP